MLTISTCYYDSNTSRPLFTSNIINLKNHYAPTSKASLPTRSHATTRYKGKEIAKPITPPSESASKEDKCDDERVALANLKLDVDENKKIQKQLKKSNATLTQELTECKSILMETSRTLGESNRLLAQKEIDIKESLKVKDYEISIVKQKHDELGKQSRLTKSHYEGLVKEKTKNDSFAFVHELKQEMHADLKYVESLEDELDELEPDKLTSPEQTATVHHGLLPFLVQYTQTDCVQDTAQRMKLKRLKASTALMTRQTDAEQRRPTIKKLEVKLVEFKLGDDCWEIQVTRSTYC
ncbi:hypothetical protein Tco_0704812 [Tanacetum coccineum]|uniref:Uncharacterized protein n=1 Tax=Tanacetum coccineum TaxID=301880 RepID=A0ABQ4Y484_9ASTR